MPGGRRGRARFLEQRAIAAPKLEIIRDEPQWIAVVKPAGLAVIPGRDEDDTVLERLARQIGLPAAGSTDPRVRVVHRLDKETSGVLLFAKSRAAQRALSHQFQNNSIEKQYLALVAGRPATDEGQIDAPLARHPADPRRMAVAAHGGRPARTAWKVEERFRRANLALLRVFPKTGKTHQIRVHLAHAGLPLAIDPLYNPPRGREKAALGQKPVGIYLSAFKSDYRPNRGQEEFPLIARLTLHAQVLAFDPPGGGERVRLESPPPKDFRAAVNQLGRHGAG
jgi:23S rRNA pseudouridine1911/1915/1917 synthase